MSTLPALLPLGPSVEDLADDVIGWLRGDAQHLFCIGEHWAGYPTEVCVGRIRAAAEIIADGLDEGRIHPECPPLDEAIMAEVWRQLDESERWAAEWEAAQATREEQARAQQAAAARDAARCAARAEREARRSDVYRRLLDPNSGATGAEREQAATLLARMEASP